MKSAAQKFIVYTIALSIACVALQMLVYKQIPEVWQLKNAYTLLAIFVIGTLGVHLLLLNSAKGSGQAFVRGFMMATMAKFFLYLSALVGFFMFSTEDKKALVLHFLFYYAIFTIFEVSVLYGDIRKMK